MDNKIQECNAYNYFIQLNYSCLASKLLAQFNPPNSNNLLDTLYKQMLKHYYMNQVDKALA
jgi:hypothetical protein